MPNIDSVVDLASLFSFIGDLMLFFLDSVKNIIEFIVNLFNVSYYSDILSSLPNPFNTIFISFIGFIFVIIIAKLLKIFFDFVLSVV